MHITVNGVALHELRRGLRGREHILVGGEVLERPSVDHSGGGGGWIGNVGVVSEGNEIRSGRVLQMVEVKLLVVRPVAGAAAGQRRQRQLGSEGPRGSPSGAVP